MPIKNYTTKIPAPQTVGEIQGILAAHGARQIMLDYSDNGHIGAITFSVDTPVGRRGFQLPARVDMVSVKGQTLYQAFRDNQLRLGAPEED